MSPSYETVRSVPTGPARRGPTGIEPARITAGQPGVEKGAVTLEGDTARIDAHGVYYKTLNEQIREQVAVGVTTVILDNVNGQRYIGAGISADGVTIVVNGVPGNDLATFMDGPTVVVTDNAQDGVGNTMNRGLVAVEGDAGDVLGYGMRGGRIYVRGDVGYRVGIHMKAYEQQHPVLVIGGRARDFFGEYMAGGEMLLLGLGVEDDCIVGSYVGTGMHGGVIYIRGEVASHQLGKEVGVTQPTAADEARIGELVTDFCQVHRLDAKLAPADSFVKIAPFTHRPYGKMYAY
ncbi:MAG: GltB/FmdC/FwdC-like GXGXG domain-containing protein [Thermoleophilia bacterium]